MREIDVIFNQEAYDSFQEQARRIERHLVMEHVAVTLLSGFAGADNVTDPPVSAFVG